MGKPKIFHVSPGRIILYSFMGVISVGTFLLSLPYARLVHVSLLDLFFTAASTTCVTGLKVVPMSSFSFFGKCVILGLIQIGGLGLLTLSFFLASFFLNLRIATRLIAGEIFEFEIWGRIRHYLTLIVGITVICESIGTFVLYRQFIDTPCDEGPFFIALFHSVSAFCNAGITIFDNNLIGYGHLPFLLITLSVLMFIGSIGFMVWYDWVRRAFAFVSSLHGTREHVRSSLHTKIAVYSSALLIIAGGLLIWSIEHDHLFSNFSGVNQIVNSFFYAICARGPGFYTTQITDASLATLFISLIFMFIGASPGSMGSGIKTTVFVVFVATVASIVRNRSSVEIGGRRIPHDQVYKVMAIVALGMFWIFLSTFIILLLERNVSFLQVLFETVSAFGTCGLSTGITKSLSSISKITLVGTMLIGRIGALTLVLALRKKEEKHLYQYPEERILIG